MSGDEYSGVGYSGVGYSGVGYSGYVLLVVLWQHVATMFSCSPACHLSLDHHRTTVLNCHGAHVVLAQCRYYTVPKPRSLHGFSNNNGLHSIIISKSKVLCLHTTYKILFKQFIFWLVIEDKHSGTTLLNIQ